MKSKIWRRLGIVIAVFNTLFIVAFLSYKAFEFHSAKAFITAYTDISFPNIFINDIEVGNLNKDSIKKMIQSKLEEYEKRTITVYVEDEAFETTLKEFHPVLNQDADQLADEIIALGKDLTIMEQVSQIKEPMYYEFAIDYSYDAQKVKEWVEEIEEAVYVAKVEPTFIIENESSATLQEGHDGQFILVDELYEELIIALDSSLVKPVEIQAHVWIDPRQIEAEDLKTINSKISSYSTQYIDGTPRASNVELAASKINQLVVMPNEVFSYTLNVAPIDEAHGYQQATTYFNGKPVPGVGGGVCQVSSTLYNAQLLAGIVATERINHSLPVSYVPLGQDAAIAEGVVDLKFVNTLTYPLYIRAYAEGGSLTVEIWSNSEALQGISYHPKSIVSSDGLKVDTTLYGYNAEGEIVYEKFLHTSEYRQKVQ